MKPAVRNAFERLGMQAKANEVVEYLAASGISVSVRLVTAVRIDLLKVRFKGQKQQYQQKAMAKNPKRVRTHSKIPPRRS